MKRLGVLLALLVLGSLLTVGTGTVKAADTYVIHYTIKHSVSTNALEGENWTYQDGFYTKDFTGAVTQSAFSKTITVTARVNENGIIIDFSAASVEDLLRIFLPDNPNLGGSVTTYQPLFLAYAAKVVTDLYNAGAIDSLSVAKDGALSSDVRELARKWNVIYIYAISGHNGVIFKTLDFNATGTTKILIATQNNGGNQGSYATFDGVKYNSGSYTLKEGILEGPHEAKAGASVMYSENRWSYIYVVFDGDYIKTNWTNQVDGDTGPDFEGSYIVNPPAFHVLFSVKDALTNQPLTGVTVKDTDGSVLGTVDDGGALEIARGTHTLTFEKSGYWSVTKTIDVENDTSLSVEMYPSSAAFKLENFPADISIPENTIYTLTFTLSPIQTSATYNTYLSISGLQNLISVKKGDSTISPENGKYYLGDISGPTQVSITFQAGAVGQHGFTLSIESHDAVMSNTYTTTKSVTYTVEPLPFSVQMPSEWQVGQNELRISESSGQSYLITAVLKDSQGNEVWSDSHAFNPYEAYTFTPKIPSEGSYTLELQFNGQTAVYSVQVNPAIALETKTLSVKKGSEGTIVLHFKNPSSDVQYYTIKVSGGFLPKAINQSISVAPATEKDVSIAFAVPDKLTYDAYELNVQVLQGNATVFSDKVAVSISDSSGFNLFGGGSSGGKTLYYAVGALVALGLFIAAARRR